MLRNRPKTENITHAPSIEQRCIHTSDWKLILTRPIHVVRHYPGDHDLYNLIEDPEEELNLYRPPETTSTTASATSRPTTT